MGEGGGGVYLYLYIYIYIHVLDWFYTSAFPDWLTPPGSLISVKCKDRLGRVFLAIVAADSVSKAFDITELFLVLFFPYRPPSAFVRVVRFCRAFFFFFAGRSGVKILVNVTFSVSCSVAESLREREKERERS